MENQMEPAKRSGAQQLFSRCWEHPATPHLKAIGQALLTLGRAMDVEVKAGRIEGHLAVLESIPPAELIKAFARALEQCRFFPSPAEMLDLAGRTNATSAMEDEARRELANIRKLQSEFGPLLMTKRGAVVKDRDSDGRALPVSEWVYGPDVAPPKISLEALNALYAMGYGEQPDDSALAMIHNAYLIADNGFATRELESRWVRAYKHVLTQP